MESRYLSERYNVMKVLLTLLVVLGHALIMYTTDSVIAVRRTSEALSVLARYIYSFHMPAFFLVSGCVYGICRERMDERKYPDGLRLIALKAKRLLIPYAVIGCLWVVPVVVILGMSKNGLLLGWVKDILLVGDPKHLWYLWVLFVIFAICAFPVKFFSEQLKNPIVELVLLLVLVVLHRYSGYLPTFLNVHLVAKRFVQFYMGILFHRVLRRIPWKLRFNAAVIPCLAGTMVLYTSGNVVGRLLQTALAALLFYCLGDLLCNLNIKENKLYKLLAKDSFGVYLLHPMFIYVVFHFLGNTSIHPILLVVLAVSVALPLSIAGTELIRRAHLKIVLGE